MNKTPQDGGPAFPCTVPNYGNGITAKIQDGMTLRDWFAGMALQGMASSQNDDRWEFTGNDNFPDWAPKTAYMLADAMLAARDRKENT